VAFSSPSRRLDPQERAAALRRLDALAAIGAGSPAGVGAAAPGDSGGWVPEPLEVDAAAPATVEAESGSLPATPESTVRDAGVVSTAALAVGSRLPEALRGGRTDPERSGLLALVVLALLAALLAGWFVLRSRPVEVAAPAPGTLVEAAAPQAVDPDTTGSAPAPPSTQVVVAVAGHVVSPGVVRLPAGSRVDDAVRAAGGVAPGADPGLLNLARVLVDGEQVLVGIEPPPEAQAPAAAPGGTAGGPGTAGSLLDLNTATASDLEDLPGVGPVLAERIVAHRDSIGRFASIDQLQEVSGIGEGRYAAVEDLITVS
jgi:competence protein ComEA